MSDVSDSIPVRNHSQAISSDNGGIRHSGEFANQDTFMLVNRILSWVVRILESKSMQTLEGRISSLVHGGWLFGKADMATIAALTNKSERTIETLVTGRPRFKVGQSAYYPIGEIAIPFGMDTTPENTEAGNVAPVKRSALRTKKKR